MARQKKARQKHEYSYLSTVVREFKLTRNQVVSAVRDGLVEARDVPNPHDPHYRAMIINRNDVKAKLAQIRDYPEFSEDEKAARKVVAQRSRLRGKLEFHCPRCNTDIRALPGSLMFAACWRGEVDAERAKRALMVAHYRHQHTGYEKLLREQSDQRYERYLELRDEGCGSDDAWIQVEIEEAKETEDETSTKGRIKAEYNAEAFKLLRQDFPSFFGSSSDCHGPCESAD
jgi:hypothetical protein